MKNLISILCILAISFIVSGCGVWGELMGDAFTGDPLRYYRDSGVIGEKKTLHPRKVYYDESTGSTLYFDDKGNSATPEVINGIANFDVAGGSFKFECLDWKYRIQKYSSNTDATTATIGSWAHLESADKKTLIQISSVDLRIDPPLNTHSLTTEQEQMLKKANEDPFIGGGSKVLTQKEIQEQMMQKKRFIEDPFVGEESRIVAQKAVEWYLNQNLSASSVSDKDGPIRFTTERISGKEFVKAEFDVWNRNENLPHKSLIWAFNHRSFWLADDGKRHAQTWICQIVTDPAEYSNVVMKAHQILETVKFN